MRKPFRLSQEALRTKNDFDAAVNAKPGLFKAQGVFVVDVKSIIYAPKARYAVTEIISRGKIEQRVAIHGKVCGTSVAIRV